MLKNKKLQIIVLVALFCCIGYSLKIVSSTGYEKSDKLLKYNIAESEANSTISKDEAIEIISKKWDIPSNDVTAISKLQFDKLQDNKIWLIKLYHKGSLIITARIDSKTGKVVTICDHRRLGEVNNVEDISSVIEIAKKVLNDQEISINLLGTPKVTPPNMSPGSVTKKTYRVTWYQTYKGVKVNGFVRVRVDKETLQPVEFSNFLLNVDNIDVNPKISEKEAIANAKPFLETKAVTLKGYSSFNIKILGLVIDKPNYDIETNDLLVPEGDPILVWYLQAVDENGKLVDLLVDAHTSEIVGFIGYR